MSRSFYKWNRALHKDVGFFCIIFTIIFAISGIAVNHIEDWNPSYKIERSKTKIAIPKNIDEVFITKLKSDLNIDEEFRSSFRESSDVIKIFFTKSTVELDLEKGEASVERVTKRGALYHANFLHLNHPKKAWTYFSDLYALLLIFLSVSGIFLVDKRYFIRRGVWYMVAATVIVTITIFVYDV